MKQPRAIAGLSSELSTVESNVENLVREIETAVAQADGLIATLKPE